MLNFDRTFAYTHEGAEYSFKVATYEGYDVLLSEHIPALAAAAIVIQYSNDPVVLVGQDFLDAPELVQRFFLYHEIGHIVKGHVVLPENADKITPEQSREMIGEYYMDRVSRTDVDPIELEADRYSADIVGDDVAIKCLIFMAEVVEECAEDIRSDFSIPLENRELYLKLNESSAKELRARARAIEKETELIW